jgi:hypothetical protein
MEQIYKARRGRGFPRGFITQLRKFHCATCAVSKRTRHYRRSKRVKVAAAKRATQARTLRTRKPSSDEDLDDSKNADHAGEQEAQKQGSGTDIKQLTCHGCQRIFGSAQGLASHSKDSYSCPSSSNYQQPTAEPARRVLLRAEASNTLHQISALVTRARGPECACVQSAGTCSVPALWGAVTPRCSGAPTRRTFRRSRSAGTCGVWALLERGTRARGLSARRSAGTPVRGPASACARTVQGAGTRSVPAPRAARSGAPGCPKFCAFRRSGCVFRRSLPECAFRLRRRPPEPSFRNAARSG